MHICISHYEIAAVHPDYWYKLTDNDSYLHTNYQGLTATLYE